MIALAVLAGIILWRIADQVSINRWVEHTDRVILTAKDTELALRDVQLSYRAYLQSSDKRYLSEFAGARSEFEGDLRKMAAEVADNAEQLQRLRKINDLQEHWFKTIGTLIGRKDNRQLTAEDLVQVRSYAEAVFNALEDFIADENRLRSVRAARQESEYRIIFILVPLLSGLAVLFLGYYGWRQIQLASEQFYEALEIAESARIEAERARNEAENE